MSSRRHRSKKAGTRRIKHSGSSSLAAFQKEITVVFLEMLMMVKLFHWKTTSHNIHKATDELYSKLNENIDSFIEVLL
jgi:DNA-binding ferritin-like protein